MKLTRIMPVWKIPDLFNNAMLRVYFMQQWFRLADKATKDEAYGSQPLRNFMDCDLSRTLIPNATTLTEFLAKSQVDGPCLRPANCMTMMRWIAAVAATMGLIACGGSQGKADAVSPVVHSLGVVSTDGFSVVLGTRATDNVAVTGYCFKTTSTPPLPTDTCFQASPQKSFILTFTPVVYVWAKDEIGNVSATYRDSVAPTVTSLDVQSVSGTTATLAATATDNMAATSYCFKTENTNPLSSDACFQTSPQKASVNLATTPITYVWAKDAVGNVSSSGAGPCSLTGYAASNASAKNVVCMKTDKGVVVVELDATRAPITVANFLAYTGTGFFTGTVFHRILSNFMIQGGGQTFANGVYTDKTPLAPIALERTSVTGLSNVRGTIAMARTSVPDSATSQFFINVVDNSTCLDAVHGQCDPTGNGYAVFGKVIDGMDVADQIKALPVQSNGAVSNPEVSRPFVPPVIKWAYQLK